LALVEQLGLLPRQVTLWGIEVGTNPIDGSQPTESAKWVKSAANQLQCELGAVGNVGSKVFTAS
jgi:hypothetical protein